MRENQDELDVESVANEIRLAFFELKRKQQNKPYRPSSRHDKWEFWMKAARKCIEHNADPNHWVEAAFRYNKISGGPYPHTIGGRQAVRWYDEFRRNHILSEEYSDDPVEQYVKSLFELAQMLFYHRTGSMEVSDNIETLKNPFVKIDPWVRVLMAPFNEEVVNLYGDAGWVDLKSSPHIYNALKNLGHDLTVFDKFR